eukprot:TRINITY_DN15980_c1_g1_i2.p1 TRINITY_DN15980_c1_g1~~TRINITY_DN15980_c1_g1_i2.p1  ORF type:complete len:348 (+),score=26.04 TRINITY_DN15980_c1_g1_i2:127-1044(+)
MVFLLQQQHFFERSDSVEFNHIDLCSLAAIAQAAASEYLSSVDKKTSKTIAVPVLAHVYDVNRAVTKYNDWARKFDTGIYHVGIEVHGVEWHFHGARAPGFGGIVKETPKSSANFVYRETLQMGHTTLSSRAVHEKSRAMQPNWKGESYHLVQKNCISFASALCQELKVDDLPLWTRHAAKSGCNLLKSLDHSIMFFGNVGNQIAFQMGEAVGSAVEMAKKTFDQEDELLIYTHVGNSTRSTTCNSGATDIEASCSLFYPIYLSEFQEMCIGDSDNSILLEDLNASEDLTALDSSVVQWTSMPSL